LTTTNYLQNKSPTKFIAIGKIHVGSWTRVKFDPSHLRIFRSKAFALIQKDHQSKLDHHAIECTFLGYNEESQGSKLMRKDDRRIMVS
jgi:hypothetical protein